MDKRNDGRKTKGRTMEGRIWKEGRISRKDGCQRRISTIKSLLSPSIKKGKATEE